MKICIFVFFCLLILISRLSMPRSQMPAKTILIFLCLFIFIVRVGVPQYKLTVAKKQISTMLPLMQQWYDTLANYKVSNGNYNSLSPEKLGITWPEGWSSSQGANYLKGEDRKKEWSCHINLNLRGSVMCRRNGKYPEIAIYQPDESFLVNLAGKRICHSNLNNIEADEICEALGGIKIDKTHTIEELYSYEF